MSQPVWQGRGTDFFFEVRCGSLVLFFRGSGGHSQKETFDSGFSNSAKGRFQRDAKNAFSGRAARPTPAGVVRDRDSCARAMTFLRAFLSPLRALNREFAHRGYVCTGRGCFHAIQLEILVRMVHVLSLDVSRASQTCLSASSCTCVLICRFVRLFGWLFGL